MLARVRASFDRQQMMSTLGVEVTSVEPGKVEMSLRHDDRFTQQHGFLHAGAVASVLDSACGYAAFSMMPPDAAVLTASYTINLLAPAAGERFTDHRRGGTGGPHPGRLPRRGVRRRRQAAVRGYAGHHDGIGRPARNQRLARRPGNLCNPALPGITSIAGPTRGCRAETLSVTRSIPPVGHN
jgi:uncharacterized protein (TIGR00369 family)